MWNWLSKLFTKKEIYVSPTWDEVMKENGIKWCLPGDRYCCHAYYSYEEGKRDKEKGLPCEYIERQGCLGPHGPPICQELWECGWRGDPMPEDVVEFCTDI